ncbi:helix-turn-helix domain-containing protein [Pseudomonas quasicaspiana]|uniref:helix-turn-helix domain-containing protein n=1 Tax=Pseudomonas quasicaspiana TaxID=2829821 RepID=UPI001E2BDC8F|nr:helix-turn-helix transcriptional regulator [Pseudomonas quasicaspiana]MCD5972021.1 helix-turn-helix transcriptional regulator [Pseudomonas quasicaspiana]
MEVKDAFGIALRNARTRRGLTQEDFHGVSSRTYLSTLERGLKNVTVEKAVELARQTGIHPLTLMVETFLILEPDVDLAALFKRVLKEVEL